MFKARYVRLVYCFISLLFVFSCKSGLDQLEEVLSVQTGVASHVSCRNAVLSAKANVPSVAAADMTFGILYSTNSGVTMDSGTQIKAEAFDAKYNFSVTTPVLEPETKYYYRAYILQAGIVTYGETKSFTTRPLSSMIQTLDATDVNPKDAVLHAKLDLTDCVYTSLQYGFQLLQNGRNVISVGSTDLSGTKYSAKVSNLTRESAYEVVAYVTMDGTTYKAEGKPLSTTAVQAELSLSEVSDITVSSAVISGRLRVTSQGSFTRSCSVYYSPIVSGLENLRKSGYRQSFSLPQQESFSVSLTFLSSATQYNYAVVVFVDGAEFAQEGASFTTLDYTFTEICVDLGLSVKWSSLNVGAVSPEEYGDYFAWGETETKENYNWSTYKWCNGSSTTLTKYNTFSSPFETVDNKTVLDPEDDVAHIKLGGKWRMPTDEEWTELRTQCTWTWTWIIQNGAKGYLVTSKKNGNSIFLPASGCRGYSADLYAAGLYGSYWSSSLWLGASELARSVSFDSGDVGGDTNRRCYGLSVRPVTE